MPFLLSAVLGLLLSYPFKFFPCLSFFLLSLPSLFFIFKKRFLYAILTLIICLAGFFYGSYFRETEDSDIKIIEIQGYVIDKKDNIYLFKTIKNETFKVYYKNILYNDRFYKVTCKLSAENRNPYVTSSNIKFCYVQSIEDKGELKLNIVEKLKNRINKKLKKLLDENTAGILVAMTTGQRYEISKETREDFQKTGLIHLLSISGAHFSLLFTVFFIIFKIFTRFIPYRWLVRVTLYIKPSQLSIILCFPILLCYYLLIEPNYPSTRAFIMAVFFMLGVLAERKSLWIITILIACFLILIIEPSAAKDLSFQLSFLATVGIGFATDIYKGFKYRIKSKVLSYLALSFLVSFSASLITAPLIIYKFHYLSIISPIANLTAGLLIGMILFPLNLIFASIYLFTGIYPFPQLVNFIGDNSFKLMHLLASFKFSSVLIPPVPLGSVVIFYGAIFLLTFSLYVLKGFIRRATMTFSFLLIFTAGLISFILISLQKESFKITFLDVGQADSAVIEAPQGVFLVDTGKIGFEAEQYLKAKGYKTIQAFIITHEQKDHAGGFMRIVQSFKVADIWDNGYIDYNLHLSTKVRHLERGDILKSCNCSFTVLHPYREFFSSSLIRDSNEVSLVFSLRCLRKTFLFTSDVGKEGLETIPIDYLKADIIKMPHHGSEHSFYKDFYKFVSPQICVFSVGKSNPYGHPHKEVVANLKNTCKIYRTDLDGAIQIMEKSDGTLEIKTFEETFFKPYKELENLKKLFILW